MFVKVFDRTLLSSQRGKIFIMKFSPLQVHVPFQDYKQTSKERDKEQPNETYSLKQA